MPWRSTMRNETPRLRLAGNRLTGRLTRPKAIVPDQNGLGRSASSPFCSSSSAIALCLPLHLLEACFQRTCDVGRGLCLARLQQLHLAACLPGGEHFLHAFAVFVVIALGFEGRLQHADELPRHGELALIQRLALRRLKVL